MKQPFIVKGRCLNRRTGRTEQWTIDLDSMAHGGKGPDPFRGRPRLTKRILPAFQTLLAPGHRSSAIKTRSNVHVFWRFLDQQEQLAAKLDPKRPVVIDDLDWSELEAIWRQFIDWLRSKSDSQMAHITKYHIAHTVYWIFSHAHAIALEQGLTKKEHLDIFIFFTYKQSASYGGDPLDLTEAKAAFKALGDEWSTIVSRVEAGNAKSVEGRSPLLSGPSGEFRWRGGPWQKLENRLWAVRNSLPFRGLCDPQLQMKIRSGLGDYPLPSDYFRGSVLGPRFGVWGHVACIFLTVRDIAVAFAMVTMRTGMNPDAIAGMRVDSWCRPDPVHPEERVILFGPKRVHGKVLRASSSKTRATDPYQIISKIIEIQAPIRARLREIADATGDQKLRELSELVWIAPTALGVTSLVPGSGCRTEVNLHMNEVLSAAGVRRNTGQVLRYTPSMGRDVWGLFVYHRTGFNYILTAQALGHSTLRSLLHYLEKRVVKLNDLKRLIDLHTQVIDDFRGGNFEPRRYRGMPALPKGTPASTGLVCTDPTHPAKGADPGNPGGRLCKAQKCWRCFNWYASRESIPYLLRMIADLSDIQTVTAVAMWETSDFPLMLGVYQYILSKFHPDHVSDAKALAESMPPIITASQFVGPRAKAA